MFSLCEDKSIQTELVQAVTGNSQVMEMDSDGEDDSDQKNKENETFQIKKHDHTTLGVSSLLCLFVCFVSFFLLRLLNRKN